MDCLNIEKRCSFSHNSSKRLRKAGKTPGVLYRKTQENFLFEVSSMELKKEISSHGEYGVVNISIDGNVEKALIKELQKDPVSHEIIHVDLESIHDNEVVVTEIPVKFINERFINSEGAVVQKEKDKIKVKCMSQDIPQYIAVNLKNRALNSSIKINDVEFGESIRFLENPNTILASISYSKKEELDSEEIEVQE